MASSFYLVFKKLLFEMLAPKPSARKHRDSHRHLSKRSRHGRPEVAFDISDDSGILYHNYNLTICSGLSHENGVIYWAALIILARTVLRELTILFRPTVPQILITGPWRKETIVFWTPKPSTGQQIPMTSEAKINEKNVTVCSPNTNLLIQNKLRIN